MPFIRPQSGIIMIKRRAKASRRMHYSLFVYQFARHFAVSRRAISNFTLSLKTPDVVVLAQLPSIFIHSKLLNANNPVYIKEKTYAW